MRGYGTDELKREVIRKMSVKHELDVFPMSETEMKSKGERKFVPVLGRVSGVDDGRGSDGVGLLSSDMMKKNVTRMV